MVGQAGSGHRSSSNTRSPPGIRRIFPQVPSRREMVRQFSGLRPSSMVVSSKASSSLPLPLSRRNCRWLVKAHRKRPLLRRKLYSPGYCRIRPARASWRTGKSELEAPPSQVLNRVGWGSGAKQEFFVFLHFLFFCKGHRPLPPKILNPPPPAPWCRRSSP